MARSNCDVEDSADLRAKLLLGLRLFFRNVKEKLLAEKIFHKQAQLWGDVFFYKKPARQLVGKTLHLAAFMACVSRKHSALFF